ncbi:MAG: enoyl-CoA hydratase [Lysobacterales bacterium CG02_land_8_20_14_3_00_62_12]|nr:MAG: enoyl-CoA hydratase [Xanthomonadales bacterium CG02_land_8_20_14_3_00_62_12]
MQETSPIITRIQQGVATIWLNRPAVHNAFDDCLIGLLTASIDILARDPSVRVIVLTGVGRSFSAGADLNWMRRMAAASEAENRADAENLAGLMRTLAWCPKPTLAKVQGSAFGGGVGLIACCDIAIAIDSARFGLTETRLGLVPAVISPYVVDAIGARNARRYFQTGEVFDAESALRMGLIQQLVGAGEDLDARCQEVVKRCLDNGPEAVQAAKQLAWRLAGRSLADQELLDRDHTRLIAELRVSAEGQEGLGAFLEKRRPGFASSDSGA